MIDPASWRRRPRAGHARNKATRRRGELGQAKGVFDGGVR